DDRDALVRGDLVVAQVGAVDDVERGRLALRTVRARDGDVDLGGLTSLSSYRLLERASPGEKTAAKPTQTVHGSVEVARPDHKSPALDP
ncbi:MAG: hypothetical protein WKF96_24870, partial [Solirubrobacteraceae bacterium]